MRFTDFMDALCTRFGLPDDATFDDIIAALPDSGAPVKGAIRAESVRIENGTHCVPSTDVGAAAMDVDR